MGVLACVLIGVDGTARRVAGDGCVVSSVAVGLDSTCRVMGRTVGARSRGEERVSSCLMRWRLMKISGLVRALGVDKLSPTPLNRGRGNEEMCFGVTCVAVRMIVGIRARAPRSFEGVAASFASCSRFFSSFVEMT